MVKFNSGYALYGIALCFTGLNLFIQVLPISTADYLIAHLSLNNTQVINISSIFLICYAIMQIPGGLIFDKFGLKIILPLGLLLTTLGSILYMLCSNGWMLGFSRCLTGLGSSIAYISGVYIAVKSFSEERLSFLIGLVEAASTIGAILAARVFHEILIHFGWQNANLLVIIFCILLLILTLICVKDLKHERNDTHTLQEVLLQVRDLLRNPVLILLFIYSFCTWAIIMSFAGYWLKNYMMHMHHYSETSALSLVQIYWTGFLVGGLIIGFFTKDINKARKIILTLAILAFINYAFMAIPILFAHFLLVTVVLIGGISTSGIILAFTLISKLVEPKLSGTAIAANNTFIVLGGLAGQLIFGFVLNLVKQTSFTHLTGIDPQYYFALLIYPTLTLIALLSLAYALKLSK